MDDLYRLLRTSHAQAQGIVDTVADPLLVLDQQLCVISASRAFFETFRVDRFETVGRRLYELGNGQWNIPALRLLLEDVIPKSAAVINYEVEHRFDTLGQRTMLLTARALFSPDNNSQLMLVSIVDATDELKRRAAKDLLFTGLRHRMKNLLGVMQSLARQTPVEGRTAADYRREFLGRLTALSTAEEVAFSEHSSRSLGTLVERVLGPYLTDPSPILMKPGPPLELGFHALQSVGLALHELATNAAKYGALSNPSGTVDLSWHIAQDHQLRITWVERGGPATAPPSGTGFGTKLIQTAIGYTLGGKVEQRFTPSGLEVDILFPL